MPISIKLFCLVVIVVSITSPSSVRCSNITNLVFDKLTDGMPAAFGDFNSDELTDVFVLRDNLRTVEILLAHEEEPLLRAAGLHCTFQSARITSVVPGDFDGDALMDVLVTTGGHDHSTSVYIIWGGTNRLNCTGLEERPLIQMIGQPLAMDYNQDMIIDLFGQNLDEKHTRMFWVFNTIRGAPTMVPLEDNRVHDELAMPHAHAFLGGSVYYLFVLFLHCF